MKNFPHLHLHTTHSHLDGYGTVEKYYETAQEQGHEVIAHTEHGNISSWVRAQVAGKETGVKPIFGIEAYIVPDILERARGYNHVTLLAQNQEGLRNIFGLVSSSYNEGFYYKPRMSWKDLLRRSAGIIVLSGCWAGFASRRIFQTSLPDGPEGKSIPSKEEVEHWMRTMKRKFDGRFYMELMPIAADKRNAFFRVQKRVLEHEIDLAKKFKVPLIATNDVHYICEGHDDQQDDLVAIRVCKSKDDQDRMRYDVTDLWMKNTKEMMDGFRLLGVPPTERWDAIQNANHVAEECNAEVPKAQAIRYKAPGKTRAVDSESYFRKVVKNMWDRRGIPTTREYVQRAKKEMSLFEAKGYVDYLLIIWDLIWAAKTRSDEEGGPILVGPSRGSSAGSLICYVLGITEIDPFYDKLIFERFVDTNRTDPPDIDIDFPDDQRDWAKKYLRTRWGADHVGTLISHTLFKGKNSLVDIARIYRVPRWAVDRVKDLLVERSSGDARASFTIEDTFKEFPEAKRIWDKFPKLSLATRLEGQIRNEGTHAAGVVLSTEEPLEKVGAFYRDGAFWLDKKDSERMNFLKIDLLGLNTLSILREAAKAIGLKGGDILDFYYNRIPMDDPETIARFTKADTDCIFQFEGNMQAIVTKQLCPVNYIQVRDLTGLSRPGPLHCGGTNTYIPRALGKDFIIEPPEIEPVVQETQGVILYQEQVMQILRDIGHMTWAQIVDIRRLISRSTGVEHFNKFKFAFMKGAVGKTGLEEKVATDIWDQMCTFGSWAFNLAHAASYTRISMWCMYMKVHHPKEFLAAVAGWSSKDYQQSRAIRIFEKYHGPILPLCINRSDVRFAVGRTGDDLVGLRPGLSDIKGIGPKAAEAIRSAQPFASFNDYLGRVPARVVNRKVRKILHAFGAFRDFADDPSCARDRLAVEADAYRAEFQNRRAFGSTHCFWVLPINFPKIRRQLSCDPLAKVEFRDHNVDAKVTGRVKNVNQRDLRELGHEDQLKKLRPGEETRFINIQIEDEESFITVTIPRRHYKNMKDLVFKDLQVGAILLAKGTILSKSRRLFCDELFSVEGY